MEIGGEVFTAPPVLAPTTLAALMDKQSTVQAALTALDVKARTDGRGALDEALAILSNRRPPPGPGDDTGWEPGIFDLILDDAAADRFRRRLYSKNSFDLFREVLPAVGGLVEEYAGPDRPTMPSPPSTTLLSGDGTTSTDGVPVTVSTLSVLEPTGS